MCGLPITPMSSVRLKAARKQVNKGEIVAPVQEQSGKEYSLPLSFLFFSFLAPSLFQPHSSLSLSRHLVQQSLFPSALIASRPPLTSLPPLTFIAPSSVVSSFPFFPPGPSTHSPLPTLHPPGPEVIAKTPTTPKPKLSPAASSFGTQATPGPTRWAQSTAVSFSLEGAAH